MAPVGRESGVWSHITTTLNGGLLVKHGIPETLDTAGSVPTTFIFCPIFGQNEFTRHSSWDTQEIRNNS